LERVGRAHGVVFKRDQAPRRIFGMAVVLTMLLVGFDLAKYTYVAMASASRVPNPRKRRDYIDEIETPSA
jgi:hypothetical protein